MELISTKICKTSDIGVNDNLFGGTMLAWLDEAGGIMASNICNSPNVVTLKMNEVLFKKPVKVKEQIQIFGKIKNIGNTSVSLYLEAIRNNFDDREKKDVVCSTELLYVKVNHFGVPIPIK